MNWKDYMAGNRRLLIATAALAAIAFLSGIALVIMTAEGGPELRVEETYFEASRRAGDRIPIEVVVILTNEGTSSAENVRVEVLAVETDSNLARSNGTSVTFELGAGRSQEIRSVLNVPRNDTFRLEILIFRAQKLTIWGSGTVDLTGLGKASDYSTEENLDVPKLEEKEGSSSSFFAGFVIIAGSAAGFSALVIYLIKKSRSSGIERPEKGEQMQPFRSQYEK